MKSNDDSQFGYKQGSFIEIIIFPFIQNMLTGLFMNSKKKKKRGAPKDKPLQPAAKSSKAKEYSKKNSKNNWSNTKSIYTRPR